MNVLRRIAHILEVVTGIGSVVPGKSKKGLTLRRHFLEIGIVGRRIIGRPPPRVAQLLGNIIRGHLTEYVPVDANPEAYGRNLDAALTRAGSRRNRLFYFEADFTFVIGVVPCRSGAAIHNY